ncbi:MAG: hypothetical protein RL308_589 [Bacteroidota bacterium]|jgi:hypothetical protein
MKKIIALLILFSMGISCQESAIPKPDNLIDEDVLVSILYDLSLLEAIKSQNPAILETNNINPNTYIYSKYKIDSLQFARSNKYYASDIKKYKEIVENVNKKIEEQKTLLSKPKVINKEATKTEIK